MSRAFAWSCLAIALLTSSSVPRARAGDWSLTPVMGEYVPVTRLAFNVSSSSLIQLEPATLIGGSLTWRRSPRFAAEAALGYGRGTLNVVGTSAADIDAAYVNTDALARWTVSGESAPARLELLVGVGAHHLRGSLADFIRASAAPGIAARTRLAVIGGFGASWPFGNGLRMRIDCEDHMHGGGIEAQPGTFVGGLSRAVQHDVSTTVGVELPL